MTPVLSVDGLRYRRGDREVLRGVDLAVGPGEFVGLVGPNGVGKSTLLRCLAGLLDGGGAVRVAGAPLAGLGRSAVARRVAIMHQDSQLAMPFSVRAVVGMGRYAHRGRAGSAAADAAAVERALAAADLLDLAERDFTRLSGGERQRVLLAKAVAQESPLLLLDEPTASLDIAYQEQILACAARLADEGRAVVAAIHDLRAAARHCRRVVLLDAGRVAADGPPDQVLTGALLSRAYGAPIRVWRNQISGLLDIHPGAAGALEGMPHVHVIGGGGSAAGVLRLLGDDGYRVSAGVLTAGDSDLLCAGIYGMPVVTGQPFSAIGDAACRDNCEWAAAADLTVLCNCAWGSQNLRNLDAAACARRLVVLEDDPIEGRDFSGGEAARRYRRLLARAEAMPSAALAGWLHEWIGEGSD